MFRPKAMPCLMGSIVLSAVFLMEQEVCIGSTPDLSGVWDLTGNIKNTWTCCVGCDPYIDRADVYGIILAYQENTESPAEFTYSSTGTQTWDSGTIIEYDLFGPGTVDEEGNVTISHDRGEPLGGCNSTNPIIYYHGDSDGCTWHFSTSYDVSCVNGCTAVVSSNANLSKQTGVQEGPAGDVTCSDDWDNDCDGLVDGADSDCGYSATANAQASTYGGRSLATSGSFNALALLLVPVGALMALRIWRRKR